MTAITAIGGGYTPPAIQGAKGGQKPPPGLITQSLLAAGGQPTGSKEGDEAALSLLKRKGGSATDFTGMTSKTTGVASFGEAPSVYAGS